MDEDTAIAGLMPGGGHVTALPIYINGRFLTQRTTGVQRVAREVVTRLDACAADDDAGRIWTLLTPPDATGDLALAAMTRRTAGRRRGQAWEQWSLLRASRNGVLLSLGNTGPLGHPRQVVMIHDAAAFAVPDSYTRAFAAWYRYAIRRLGRTSAAVVTPSAFSRDELVRRAGVPLSRIVVAPPGVEHVRATPADVSILERHDLVGRRYVLAVGGGAKHKNVDAVLAMAGALAGRDVRLAIVGGGDDRVFSGPAVGLGYCTDGQLRALYEHAACLAFPSLYEGFGLPPLEAMACGCPVVIARAASLPEVGGDAAAYCEPADTPGLEREVLRVLDDADYAADLRDRGRRRAAQFTWERTAQIIRAAVLGVS